MDSSFDQTIFSFSKGLFQLIEVMEVGVTNRLLDLLDPLVPLRFGLQIVDSSLIGEYQHEWKHY
jgi:hypothetical protein